MRHVEAEAIGEQHRPAWIDQQLLQRLPIVPQQGFFLCEGLEMLGRRFDPRPVHRISALLNACASALDFTAAAAASAAASACQAPSVYSVAISATDAPPSVVAATSTSRARYPTACARGHA